MPRDTSSSAVSPTAPVKQDKKPYTRSPQKLKTMWISQPGQPRQLHQPRSLKASGTHVLFGEGSRQDNKSKPTLQESAVQRLFLALNAMELGANQTEHQGRSAQELSLVNVVLRHSFSSCALKGYLDDAQHGWVQRTDYANVAEDLEVYDQKMHKPTIHGDVKRLVIVSPEGALAADRIVKNEQRGKKSAFIITSSLWAYALSTTFGGEPFFLFYRHAGNLSSLKYYGRCKLHYQQDHLSGHDWDELQPTEQNVVTSLLRKFRNLEIQGQIQSPVSLSELAPRTHSRIYIIERDGQALPFFQHVKAAEAMVLVTPWQIAAEAKGLHHHK